MNFRMTMPKRTIIGALDTAEQEMATLGRKALIVTGRTVAKTGAMRLLTGLLSRWGIGCEVYAGVTGEPTDTMIAIGVTAWRASGCDFIIGLGGGSPLDSAKAIAAMSVLPGGLSDYMGVEIEGRFPPVALIPTTAGTGSEATKFTVITDTARNVKMLLKGDALLPDLAVVDHTLTFTSPPEVTAATGMDALTHAVEAYTSRKANAMTDILALDAIRRIFRSLPAAYRDGAAKEAREDLALAAYEAGICINNASVTLVHGMSRPVGALFHVSHGISNAMLLPGCLSYVIDGCFGRFAALGRAIGAAEGGAGDKEAAEAFLKALKRLCRDIEIPTLEKAGIDRDLFYRAADKMARDAMASGSPSNTIKDIGAEDLLAIYGSLW